MSYVPPHKRPSNRNPTPTPVPSSLNPKPFASPRHRHHQKPRLIPFSPRLISRWYATSTESLALVPYDSEAIERKYGSKPLTVNVTDEAGLVEEEERGVLRGIVEKVARDLIEAGQHAKEESRSGDVKLLVMARVGKVLFRGDRSVCLDSIIKAPTSERGLNKLHACKTFYTTVSEEYIREVEELLVDKCGFKFVRAKERYYIRVLDKRQPDLIISCKCAALHDSGLELYKVEHIPLRHMVTDVSCLSKNFDLRIMLNAKRPVKNLDADVAKGINQLISAAVIDPEVKGGLRWPLGKESAADQFVIMGVWHTEHKILNRDKIRVNMRQADRFDYHSSTGEDANEIWLKLSGLSEQLTEDHLCEGSIVDMIQEVVALIWGNLLSNSTGTVVRKGNNENADIALLAAPSLCQWPSAFRGQRNQSRRSTDRAGSDRFKIPPSDTISNLATILVMVQNQLVMNKIFATEAGGVPGFYGSWMAFGLSDV
ncbi:hypothetical protein FCM35_KLT12410 [Carex littledalei]|uniref:DUF7903 domain-containing protein n=1 Tax=Carex littledalei TaxID=544730 RepID=A0A833QJF2_9POAL|nr:hypothetical protein FCM35_KLT12410 [Carex littledalei]